MPYKGKGVSVLAVSSDDKQTLEDWISTYNLTYPVLHDPAGTVYDQFGTGETPLNIVMKQGFTLIYSKPGYSEGEIISAIESVLPPVTVNLNPENTSAGPGEIIDFDLVVQNETDTLQTVDLWIEVFSYDHVPYPGNPVGLTSEIIIAPGDPLTGSLSYEVPVGIAEAKGFIIRVMAGTYGEKVLTSDHFRFEIKK